MDTEANTNGRPSGGRFGFGELLISLVLILCWFLALRPAVDPDYGWHIANGGHVLDGSAFAGRDLYSWTASGLWVVHEWMFEALMRIVHDSFGATGNSLVAATLWTLAFGLVAVRLRARGFTSSAIAFTVGLGFLCTMMSVGVRPQVLELVYLSVFLLAADRFRRGVTSALRFTVATVVLAVLWVNTHGSFPLLIVALLIHGAGELFERGPRARTFFVVAVLSVASFLVNPWGYHILSFALQSIQSAPTLSSIDEWKAPRLSTGSLIPFNVSALLALGSTFFFLRRRTAPSSDFPGRAGPHAADVLLFLALLYLGLQSGRHVMLLGIGSAPLIADAIMRAGRNHLTASGLEPGPDARARSRINIGAATTVAVAVLMLGWSVINPAAQAAAMANRYPVQLVDQIRQLARDPGSMFNEYAWGGFLIGQGIRPVFIDGRSELYGDAQLVRYGRITRMLPGWDVTLDSLRVESAVLPRSSRLANALSMRGWRTVASDTVGVLLRRR